MKTFDSIGIGVPKILLPRDGVDLTKWAVVACDQYTSEPEYWAKVFANVGDAPSTANMIFPEVFLGDHDAEARIASIQSAMKQALDGGVLETKEGFVYVERTAAGRLRRGLMVAMDLEAYDYTAGASSLVRATEGTIVDRLPPRIRVREGAPIELPHIMVLIDDPERTVIEPIANSDGLETVYDFDLMLDGGHLRGARVSTAETDRIAGALAALGDPSRFDGPPLLYAMGDGNHSLATAKAIWEKVKADAPADDPRRWALVELVNVHDESLVFEPIHRVLFDVADGWDPVAAFTEYLGGGLELEDAADLDAMTKAVEADAQHVGVLTPDGYKIGKITKPKGNLAVASLQAFLNDIAEQKRFREVDYVHGTEAVDKLGRQAGNAGFFLGAMDKNDLFKTVILDGALPRKTFSMGEADEKRFYMEARRLT